MADPIQTGAQTAVKAVEAKTVAAVAAAPVVAGQVVTAAPGIFARIRAFFKAL
jgi:hypothetical protein